MLSGQEYFRVCCIAPSARFTQDSWRVMCVLLMQHNVSALQNEIFLVINIPSLTCGHIQVSFARGRLELMADSLVGGHP